MYNKNLQKNIIKNLFFLNIILEDTEKKKIEEHEKQQGKKHFNQSLVVYYKLKINLSQHAYVYVQLKLQKNIIKNLFLKYYFRRD